MIFKVCGVSSEKEISILHDNGVHWAGLWFNMKEGNKTLDFNKFVDLSKYAKGKIEIVGVTTEHDLLEIDKYVKSSGMPHLQLHGFQTPILISCLKDKYHGQLSVIKTLHINGNECIEENLIDRYIQAGVDYFILDYFQNTQSIGSTGKCINKSALLKYCNLLKDQKVIVAGGVNPDLIRFLHSENSVIGVDIDSYARSEGNICTKKVQSLVNSVSLLEEYA